MYVDKSLRNGLVGEWLCKPMTGDKLLDTSGFGAPGLIASGCDWIAGMAGLGLRLDIESGSAINFGTNPAHDFTGDYTLELYADLPENAADTMSYWIYRRTGNTGYFYQLLTVNRFRAYHGNGVALDSVTTGTNAIIDGLHHYCFVYTASETNFKLYRDASVIFSDSTLDAPVSNSSDLLIESDATDTQIWYHFATYNRALTQPEVSTLYQRALRRGQPDQRIWHIPFVEQEDELVDSLIAIPGGMTPLEPWK